ncbi:MAG: beta-lactamase family protein [Acidimicrobiales bacterium]|nr:beta-lactamase family protein [Acidimicrobiales bacterium]
MTVTRPADPPIGGNVDPAFAVVRDAFEANFTPTEGDPGDLGASVHVIVDGRCVVDLWGGWADLEGSRPWKADTLVNAYSVGKAMVAATVLSVVADGTLDLDAPLAGVWPEFAAHGKGAVTLRDAMAHRAAVPGIDRPVADDEVFDFERIAAAVAETEPWWEPGSAHGYHVNTLGHVLGEPVRRVTGRTVGAVLRERFAGPLDADVWFGLPASEHGRVAEVDFVQHVPEEFRPHGGPTRLERMRRAAYFNPEGLSGIGTVNTTRWREAEVPSTNLHATARGVARVFASLLADDGPVPGSLVAEAARTHSSGHDLVLDRDSHFGLAMMLHQDGRPIGTSPASYGHFGNGGSLGFADPAAGLAFGYVINRPGDRWQVPRTRRLLDALRTCLGA